MLWESLFTFLVSPPQPPAEGRDTLLRLADFSDKHCVSFSAVVSPSTLYGHRSQPMWRYCGSSEAEQGPLAALISGSFWGQQGEAGCRRDQDRSLALSCLQVAMGNVSPGAEVRCGGWYCGLPSTTPSGTATSRHPTQAFRLWESSLNQI